MLKKLTGLFRRIFEWDLRVSVTIQLLAATLMWLIGASILLVRGFTYIYDRHWHAWALSAGLILGAIKSRTVLDRTARKAVNRIMNRGTAGFFGFMSVKSWLFIGAMMGSGMILRRIVVHPGVIGTGIMGALYIGVGSALLIADHIFLYAFYVSLRNGKQHD